MQRHKTLPQYEIRCSESFTCFFMCYLKFLPERIKLQEYRSTFGYKYEEIHNAKPVFKNRFFSEKAF